MKENKETLRDAMDRRLSFLDERPSCRAGLLQRIAREEEPVVKKKISFVIVLALVLAAVSAIALAAGLGLFSPRVEAAKAADLALREKYGITPDMQTYFYREAEEQPDGSVRVTYTGKDLLACALGTYTAEVRNGSAAVTWSHDGEATSGGYEADAWGAEQLRQMLLDNQATGDMSRFSARAAAIAEAQGQPYEDGAGEAIDPLDWVEAQEREKTAALNARKLSEEEMRERARQAVVQQYDLSEAQAAILELYVQPLAVEANAWYWMEDGIPCFEVHYGLDQDPEHPETHVEMDGDYAVLVNVETGVIEKIVYESGLGGEG